METDGDKGSGGGGDCKLTKRTGSGGGGGDKRRSSTDGKEREWGEGVYRQVLEQRRKEEREQACQLMETTREFVRQ